MNVAKEYKKHPITGEMIKPCEIYQEVAGEKKESSKEEEIKEEET